MGNSNNDTENLLEETLEIMADHGKAASDVRWCAIDRGYQKNDPGEMYFTWDDFSELADVKYDSGFGGTNVPDDMKVVGDDWWLERHEYDGAEWWEFKTLPVKPETYGKPDSIITP